MKIPRRLSPKVLGGMLLAILCTELPARVPDATEQVVPKSMEDFLQVVGRQNLELAARRFDVSMAEAMEAASRMWPNPELELVYERERVGAGEEAARPARGIGIVQPIETGGKRSARRASARAQRLAEAAGLDDFWRELRLEAASAFIEALRAAKAHAEMKQVHEILKELLSATRLLFEVGDIPEVDFLQVRIEERQIRGELLAMEWEARAAALALNGFLGLENAEIIIQPVGNLEPPGRANSLDSLVQHALSTRHDLLAARRESEMTQAERRLARAERYPDLELGVGVMDEREPATEEGRSPRVWTWAFTVSVPLPVFDTGRHEERAARMAERQAELLVRAIEVQIRREVREHHATYAATLARLSQFEEEILEASREVAAAKLLAYQQGETSLLELLDAQRTANELQQDYVEALAESILAKLQLDSASGLVDGFR